jgi:hypothetical protein
MSYDHSVKSLEEGSGLVLWFCSTATTSSPSEAPRYAYRHSYL